MSKRILVVDDDPVTIEMLKSRLEKNNFAVDVAYNGEEGIQKVKAHTPDLVILDVNMPKMDGYTFVLEFKKILDIKKTPIIILTVKDTLQDIFKIEGVKDYIVKPFKTSELFAKVRIYLGLPEGKGDNASA